MARILLGFYARKKILIVILILILSGVLAVYLLGPNQTQVEKNSPLNAEMNGTKDSIVYDNTQYGFRFCLPESWKGYQIITGQWEGLAQDSSGQGERVVQTGPLISIRHPQWTSQNPRQDIPIMVFTLQQWDALQRDEFHIGVAPIGPSELGRNSRYVFALPARYNFAFLPGYKEVEAILNCHPLQPTEDFESQ
ncbi:MAG: hypothetical protein ACM3NT_09635 [Methylocystaceae bacterium]